jgi:exopolysaccharide/PEP-CTERM locus tyrosine autokinase
MNKHSALRSGSLLERAAAIYGFDAAFRSPSPQPSPEPQPVPAPVAQVVAAPAPEPEPQPEPQPRPEPEPQPRLRAQPRRAAGRQPIDRAHLRAGGFIVPEAPVTGLAEEIRIVKRQLLLGVRSPTAIPEEKRRTILVASGQPGEGKTFCAVNLALSLASEKDLEVLLVDGDFPKPEIPSLLGIEAGPGLVDAIADPSADPERFVIETDVEGLSVLPAGRHANNVPELLASRRSRQVLASLTASHPTRLVIFDSPPALAASPASVLAAHAGQTILVVKADETTETDLRETAALLSGCDTISLLLNGTGLTASGRRFGSYYGYGQ